MSLLMHYPEQSSVMPVLECCDMCMICDMIYDRGVIIRSIDYTGAVFNYANNNTNTNANANATSNKYTTAVPVTKR